MRKSNICFSKMKGWAVLGIMHFSLGESHFQNSDISGWSSRIRFLWNFKLNLKCSSGAGFNNAQMIYNLISRHVQTSRI